MNGPYIRNVIKARYTATGNISHAATAHHLTPIQTRKMWQPILIGVFVHLVSAEDSKSQTLTLAYSLPWSGGWPVGGTLASAIVLGIKEVHNRQLLNGYEVEWIWRDSYCEPRRGMQAAVDMWTSVDKLDGIIGDGCSNVCEAQGLLAAAWGIPMVSWYCSSPALSDKSVYPTFTRLKGPWTHLGHLYNAIANTFNWQRLAIIFTGEGLWALTANAIKAELEKYNKTVIMRLVENTARGDEIDTTSMDELRRTLLSLRSITRIICVLSFEPEQDIIFAMALQVGMMNGDYIFINQGTISTLLSRYTPYQSDKDSWRLEGLLGVLSTPPSGPQFERFLQDVIDTFQDPIFDNVSHLPPTASISQVSQSAGKVPYISILQFQYLYLQYYNLHHSGDYSLVVCKLDSSLMKGDWYYVTKTVPNLGTQHPPPPNVMTPVLEICHQRESLCYALTRSCL